MNASEAKALFKKEFFDGEKSLSSDDDIMWAIEKAYQDMMLRTISGVGAVENLKNTCCDKVKTLIDKYFGAIPETPAEFDEKHSKMCEGFLEHLNSELDKSGVTRQKYGKAQKIINMTFKYLSCFNGATPEQFQFCHMPLDSYILNWYKSEVNPAKLPAWSNLDKPQYEGIRDNIRLYIADSKKPLYKKDESIQKAETVLECEFLIWQEEKRRILLKLFKSCLKACEKDWYFKDKLSDEDKKEIQDKLNKILS